MFITAAAYPPSILLTGVIVNKHGQALRRRGLLPLAHVGVRAWISRTKPALLDRRRGTHSSTRDAVDPFLDGWETVAEMEAAPWHSGGQPGGDAGPLQRVRCHAARTPTSTSSRNSLRHKTKGRGRCSTCHWAGDVLGIHHRRAGRHRRRPGAARGRQVVPGLYAVGACASNIAQDGKGYASGTQLGEGSFFGRRAGTHAARAPLNLRAAPAPTGPSRHWPPPSSSSSCSWCCSTVWRWLTLTTTHSGNSLRSNW